MKTYPPLATEQAIKQSEGTDGAPIVQLRDTLEARTWIKEVKHALKAEQANTSFKYRPPEHPEFTEVVTLEKMIQKLENKEPIDLWELCREIYPGKIKSNGGFEKICQALYG